MGEEVGEEEEQKEKGKEGLDGEISAGGFPIC